MSREFYFDNGAVKRSVINDSHSDDITFHSAQDMEPVIELAGQMREANEVIGHRKSKNLVPVAEIPMQIYEQAFREGWLHDKKKWNQWLNDPQNKCFRITDGRV